MSAAIIRLHAFPFVIALSAGCLALPLAAQSKPNCAELPDAGRLRSVVQSVVREGASKNSGLGNQEWAAVVDRDGVVCAITSPPRHELQSLWPSRQFQAPQFPRWDAGQAEAGCCS